MVNEQPLAGGMDPAAGVVRIGDTVRRPAGRQAVRSLLLHLEAVGFEAAPRFLGTDDEGREVLTFLDGDVPLPPYPSWALTDAALQDLGRLVRRFHDATAGVDAAAATGWSGAWADPEGGPVICHNDLFPENVVFRDGHVVGLIDFAEAGPGRPFWDLAIAAQEWAPLHAPGARLHHPDDLDGVRRTALLLHAYGIDRDRAEEFVDVVAEEREQQLGHVREMVAAGEEPWTTFWRETDGEARAAADDAWLQEQRSALIDAIRGG
jgi:aminoglycoside phosphotransferase (APT) family kinase protein